MPNEQDLKKLSYLQSMVENITDIITILEADGRIRYQSPSITPALGYSPQEMQGTSVFSYINPDDNSRVFSLFMAAVLKKNAIEKTELRFRHKDGSWRYLECIGKNSLFDPNLRGVIITSRDVTDRRTYEARMRLQSEALEAASNGIVITERDGAIVWANAAFSRITGYSLAEVAGKNPRILKSGEQNAQVYKELWATILSGNAWSGELINRRKDGTQYFERMTITPVKCEAGKITHFIAIKQDISKEKRLEAQFRQAQKMEAVGLLAGGVAHDFNNLLTVIMGQAQLMMMNLPPDNPMREGAEEINRSGMRAAGLTRQLLAFSRKQIFSPSVLDLNEIVRGMDKMIRRLLGENIELVTLFGEDLKPVKVDQGQIEQVIMNLAVNARDAMPSGGKLIMETSQVTFDAKDAERYMGLIPGEYLRLNITDTGTGMSEEVKSQLFTPFFTTKETGKGTGLGLATVYGIMKQSQGYVFVDSQLGKGTCFFLLLPPTDEDPSKSSVVSEKKLCRGSETILFVEDEEHVRGLAVHVLTRQGFRVIEASNGIEALELAKGFRDGPIQLLVTDMVMPHMGGNELAEKYSKLYPGTRIIFSSGYTDNSAVKKWLDLGYRFIQKPYSIAELLVVIREVLDTPAPKS